MFSFKKKRHFNTINNILKTLSKEMQFHTIPQVFKIILIKCSSIKFAENIKILFRANLSGVALIRIRKWSRQRTALMGARFFDLCVILIHLVTCSTTTTEADLMQGWEM